MSELKPCPGCHSSASIHDLAAKTMFFGECDRCGWRGPPRMSEDEAITAWNRRPPGYREGAEAMRERAAGVADLYEKELVRMAVDTWMCDPLRTGDLSPDAQERSLELGDEGWRKGERAETARHIAAAIRTLPLPSPPEPTK